jgi:Leucine-rich repeat (LRR) protein
VSNNALRHLAGLQLQRMPALRVLHLDKNVGLGATLEQQQQQQHSRRRKSASVPAVIAAPIALPQLIELSLQCCAIGGLPSSFLAGLPSLRTLRLSNNRLKSLAPWTAHHSLLTQLHVDGNRLSDLDETLALLPRLDGLQQLVLSGNAVTRAPQYRISITAACGGELQRLDGVQISDADLDAAAAMLSAGLGKKAVAAVKASISKDHSYQAAPSAPPLLRAPLGGDTMHSLAPAVSSTPSLMDVTADVSAEALDEALLQLHVPSKMPKIATRVALVQQLGVQQQLLPPLPAPAPQKQRRSVEKRSIAIPPNLANAPLGLTISGISMTTHSATKKDSLEVKRPKGK